MNVVQIGLPRDRARSTPSSEPLEDRASSLAAAANEGGAADGLTPVSFGLVSAGGLGLLAPLALRARDSRGALLLLLVGLVVLTLITVLRRIAGRSGPG